MVDAGIGHVVSRLSLKHGLGESGGVFERSQCEFLGELVCACCREEPNG